MMNDINEVWITVREPSQTADTQSTGTIAGGQAGQRDVRTETSPLLPKAHAKVDETTAWWKKFTSELTSQLTTTERNFADAQKLIREELAPLARRIRKIIRKFFIPRWRRNRRMVNTRVDNSAEE